MPPTDPTPAVIAAITHTIQIATPRNTTRGRKTRNRVVKDVIAACKGLMYDARYKAQAVPADAGQ